MKKISLFLILLFIWTHTTQAQSILYKIKDKAEDKLVDDLFNSNSKKDNPTGESNSSTSSNKNTKGEGLENTTPDVVQNIDDASSSFTAKNYNSSKFSIQQAMMGIELELGKEILASLPETVAGLPKEEGTDKVSSTGVGFAGLSMERKYSKNDKELSFMVANNSLWLSGINMYLTGAYGTSDEQQNWKRVQFQGNDGVIEYDENSGYKLSIPFGQVSILLLEGINFDNEKSFMAAANEFSLEKIQKKLGDQ